LDAGNSDRGVIVANAGLSRGIASQCDALKTLAVWRDVVTPEPGPP
jgi:hypothetical protein